MVRGSAVACFATCVVVAIAVTAVRPAPAHADGSPCATTYNPVTNSLSTPSAPPCWTDVTPYPFGSDGDPVNPGNPNDPTDPNNPVDPKCLGQNAGLPFGPNWQGDFARSGGGVTGNPPCYLEATSFAFRAWNRGLAATSQPTRNHDASPAVAFGVWLYNGSNWFPDPTFPGSAACPGSTVLWAGKLDYWLIGSSSPGGSGPQRTLCRFDGVNLEWEPLSLPAATVARLPVTTRTVPPSTVGGITSGGCYAWNNCWFFGTDGIEVHWDGQALTDASVGLATSPWLQDDFSAAVAGTDAAGRVFGLAAARSSKTTGSGSGRGTAAPDGSPPTQLFTSQGGPFAASTSPPPATDPACQTTGCAITEDFTAASADSQGDVWVAADPVAWDASGTPNGLLPSAQPAPLERLSEGGAQATCAATLDQAGDPFRSGPTGTGVVRTWTGIAASEDGNAFATAQFTDPSQIFPSLPPEAGPEPALVHAVCGQPSTITEFRRPNPLIANQNNPQPVPADFNGLATAVAAPAPNDVWAATTDGSWSIGSSTGEQFGSMRPHLYQWTDGQPPDAPAGDDNEQRPSLFTLDPPVYQVAPPTVVVTPVVVTTTVKRQKTKKVKLKPPIYEIHSRVVVSGGTYTLYLTFKVRRPVTLGLQGVRDGKVVASTGLKHFKGHSGQLALTLDRNHWPTKLRLQTPKPGNKLADAPSPSPVGVNPVKATR